MAEYPLNPIHPASLFPEARPDLDHTIRHRRNKGRKLALSQIRLLLIYPIGEQLLRVHRTPVFFIDRRGWNLRKFNAWAGIRLRMVATLDCEKTCQTDSETQPALSNSQWLAEMSFF